MPGILLIDTSSSVCTAALCSAGSCRMLAANEPRAHAQQLLGMIVKLLSDCKETLESLDALAVIAGPGSFTGLRIGIGVIQGLAHSLHKPVILLSSLETLALAAARKHASTAVLVALNSREDEIYFAGYLIDRNGNCQPASQPQVGNPASIVMPMANTAGHSWHGIGNGWQHAAQIAAACAITPTFIDAQLELNLEAACQLALAKFTRGEIVTAEQALPIYLKDHMDYVTK